MTTDALASQFPESPPAERSRFLECASGDVEAAAKALREHLTWRAANMPLPAEAPRLGKQLPEYTHFFSDLKDCDGGSVFFAQPALIDLDKAEPEAYALATAELVERHVPRESEGRFTVVVDLAAIAEEQGGINNPAPRLFSTLRALNATLSYNYPGRLNRIVLYPLPLAIRAIWKAASMTLDPEVVEKCVLLAGDGSSGGRVPVALDEYVSAEAVNKSAAAKARMVDVGAPPAGYLDGYMSSALTSMYDSSGNLSSMLSSVSISDSKAYVSESLSSWRKAIW